MLHQVRRRRRLALAELAIGALFVAVGVGVFVKVLAGPMWRAREARAWSTTTCRIEASTVEREVDPDGDATYRLVVRYRFTVDGRAYQGDRLDFLEPRHSGRARADADHVRVPEGADLPCYYDPADPRRSVLERRGWPGPVGLAPLGFAIMGMFVVLDGLRARWGRPPAPRSLPGGGVVLVVRGRAAAEVWFVGAFALMLGTIGLEAILQLGGWMGIVVAAFGVLFVGWFAYALAARLTRLEVVLDRDAIRGGEVARARWRIGAPFGARAVHVELIGREVVRYAEGDDTKEDTHELVRTRVDGAGEAAVRVPRGAPASLRIGPNRVDWHLRVTAALPLWPDLAAEAELDVLPSPPVRRRAPAAPPEIPRGPITLETPPRLAPGSAIAGEIAWQTTTAPRAAVLRLGWTTEGVRAAHTEWVGEVRVEDLPRVVRPGPGAGPYRTGATDDAPGPLAPDEHRRFRFPAPESPASYAGQLFVVRWQLQLELDGVVVQDVPVVLDPAAGDDDG